MLDADALFACSDFRAGFEQGIIGQLGKGKGEVSLAPHVPLVDAHHLIGKNTAVAML